MKEKAKNTNGDVDLLMITYNRPQHTQKTLPHLLDNIDDRTRVWLWHNGNHKETLEIVKEFAQHPSVYEFHHSKENLKLREPTNWLLKNSRAAYVSKVDDDCQLPRGWIDTLRAAHIAVPQFGVIGCWRFQDEDFDLTLANKKIQQTSPDYKVLRNPWVEGSGFLMKRACVDEAHTLGEKETFTDYCVRLALKGWINGWLFPFVRQEHLDDPRAPHTLIECDDDLEQFGPLSAKKFGASSFDDWDRQLRRSARTLQTCPWEAKWYVGWRGRLLRYSKKWLQRP